MVSSYRCFTRLLPVQMNTFEWSLEWSSYTDLTPLIIIYFDILSIFAKSTLMFDWFLNTRKGFMATYIALEHLKYCPKLQGLAQKPRYSLKVSDEFFIITLSNHLFTNYSFPINITFESIKSKFQWIKFGNCLNKSLSTFLLMSIYPF